MSARLTFLGTGTSFGVPVVGCSCETCTSSDERDRRTRSGAVVHLAGGTVLVDTPPELRLQLLRSRISEVDAVWFTHGHADHTHGIDDLRVFTVRGRAVTAHVAREHVEELRARFPYIFDPTVKLAEGTTKPRVHVVPFLESDEVPIAGESFLPLAVPHGPATVYGFRVGDLGYVTDGKCLPPDTMRKLAGVRVLVLNALWFGNPHPTHFNVEEAVEAARKVGAERTYLTHMTHRVRHRELEERLPPGVAPAYDGLTVEV